MSYLLSSNNNIKLKFSENTNDKLEVQSSYDNQTIKKEDTKDIH